MSYIPHTPEDMERMLSTIGVDDVADLFDTIPKELHLRRAMQLPEPLPECRLRPVMEEMAHRNQAAARATSFAGAGIYRHFIPAAIGQLLLRSEFYTAYTPYQPEVSQGTLQAIFEYQTLISRLLEMEVSNASMYDGSTAMAEAVEMAIRVFRGKRSQVVLAGAIHPEYVEVTRANLTEPEGTLVVVPDGPDGRTDLAQLERTLGDHVAGVCVQYPNFLGLLDDLAAIRELTARHKSLLIVIFSQPIAFGLIKPPGAFGADIVAGEGQPLGLPAGFGGPLLGIMTTRKSYVRALPGRLVGKTRDRHGNDAFVVTLATREQHIRREKATSNICTNEGLCALGAAIYLSLLGKKGLAGLASLNHRASRYMASRLAAIPGCSLPYRETPWFNEFVVELPVPAAEVCRKLENEGLLPGLPLSRFLPNREKQMLVAVTEMNSAEQMADCCSRLADVVA